MPNLPIELEKRRNELESELIELLASDTGSVETLRSLADRVYAVRFTAVFGAGDNDEYRLVEVGFYIKNDKRVKVLDEMI